MNVSHSSQKNETSQISLVSNPGFPDSWLGWQWASYLRLLCLNFFTCQMGIITWLPLIVLQINTIVIEIKTCNLLVPMPGTFLLISQWYLLLLLLVDLPGCVYICCVGMSVHLCVCEYLCLFMHVVVWGVSPCVCMCLWGCVGGCGFILGVCGEFRHKSSLHRTIHYSFFLLLHQTMWLLIFLSYETATFTDSFSLLSYLITQCILEITSPPFLRGFCKSNLFYHWKCQKDSAHKETWSFLGCQDPEAASGAAVKEAKASPFPSGFNSCKLSNPGRSQNRGLGPVCCGLTQEEGISGGLWGQHGITSMTSSGSVCAALCWKLGGWEECWWPVSLPSERSWMKGAETQAPG